MIISFKNYKNNLNGNHVGMVSMVFSLARQPHELFILYVFLKSPFTKIFKKVGRFIHLVTYLPDSAPRQHSVKVPRVSPATTAILLFTI